MADSEVVRKFLSERSSEAFELVVDEYLDVVRGTIYRIVLNESDADDLTQETFISVYRNVGGFKGGASFGTWIRRIACNRALSHCRSRRRKPVVPLDGMLEPAASASSRPDSEARRREFEGRVEAALSELSEELRAAITLVGIDGMSVDDAASVLGCPKATVYWRLHKARKRLRETMGEGDR